MTYTKLVNDQIKMYENWIAQVKAIDVHAGVVERLIEEFPEGHYHTTVMGHAPQVSFKLKSAKTLERMLLWLRGVGYKSHRVSDSPATKCRTFYIHADDTVGDKSTYAKKNMPDIQLEAYFQDDDATCKYVEVGTKTVEARPAVEAHEVPVYELQCDGEAVTEEPEPVTA